MEFYGSKKAILEYCWKDGKDVRWLDRAIKDGRIWVCGGDYYVVSEYIVHLEEENWKLEEEMVKWRKLAKELEWKEEKSEWINSQNLKDNAKILELSSEIEKLKEENAALRMVNEELKRGVGSEWEWDKAGYIKFSKLLSKDLYDHAKYFYERFVEWKSFVDGKAFWQMQYNNQQWKQDTIEMVKPEVYARYNFKFDEIVKAEMEFMEALIKEKKEEWLELPF